MNKLKIKIPAHCHTCCKSVEHYEEIEVDEKLTDYEIDITKQKFLLNYIKTYRNIYCCENCNTKYGFK
jgi:hypothetical protein